jgi:hypothetical protein
MLRYITKISLTLICFMAWHGLASAQEREWLLNAADEDVFLLFGVPSSNDVGVSFWCKIGSTRISLFAPLPANAKADAIPPAIELQVGTEIFKLQTKPATEDANGTVEAPLIPQDSILQKLQEAGVFNLTIGKHKATYPLLGADITGFNKLCSTPPTTP